MKCGISCQAVPQSGATCPGDAAGDQQHDFSMVDSGCTLAYLVHDTKLGSVLKMHISRMAAAEILWIKHLP
jgi:hypothetical protein